MNLEEFKAQVPHPLRVVTLVLFTRQSKVLLAVKGRDFGEGMWNAPGGKLQDGENEFQAATRESVEEVGLRPLWLRRVALLNFYFGAQPLEKDWNQQVQVFLSGSWSGELRGSEEMHNPTWFEFGQLPLEQMWPFDRIWLPKVLAGERLTGEFLFGENNEPLEHQFLPYPDQFGVAGTAQNESKE